MASFVPNKIAHAISCGGESRQCAGLWVDLSIQNAVARALLSEYLMGSCECMNLFQMGVSVEEKQEEEAYAFDSVQPGSFKNFDLRSSLELTCLVLSLLTHRISVNWQRFWDPGLDSSR